ncbi:hypothetical protein FNH22_07840 [Fulvivirga sp. M361]|uniref:hypothetical protein n=1 Tax=Fulvivirga sp. M361 TaxID=2594266 RepID=UPI00117A2C8B|nr:hypothetical protein [Fulvivirga sp. M361]TRX59956.1 hypothetical protein FNH22_07840 [Fulvivirga sp. M361]
MKKRIQYILTAFMALAFLNSCEEEDGILNDKGFEAEITTISVEGMLGEPAVNDQIVRAFLEVIVGEEDDLTALSPIIEITPGTSITPASGSTHDFSSDTVTYTITAANGRTKDWMVFVNNLEPEPEPDAGFLLTSFEESENIMTVSWLGGVATQIDNPFSNEDNPSNKVMQLSKIDASSYGYTQANALVGLEVSKVDWDLSNGQVFSLLVYNPNSDPAKMTMRLESGDLRNSVSTTTTVSSGWERVFFDYSRQDLSSVVVEKTTWFFDEGNGDKARVFYIDDFRQFKEVPQKEEIITNLASFEDGNNIMSVSWLGGTADVLDNPDASEPNTSSKVVRLSKVEASSYGYTQANALIGVEVSNLTFDIANGQKFRLKVYNPNASAVKMTMRLEYGDTRNSVSAETTKTNEWEELIFDYSGQDLSGVTIEKLTWFFDEGNDDVSRIVYIDDLAHSKEK